MPEIQLGPGLSDFDLTAPSDSSSLSPDSDDSPDLQELLGSQLLDSTEKARIARTAADEARGKETRGVKDRIFGKEGLAALTVLLGGVAAGSPGFALGAGIGGLDAIGKAEATERSLNRKAAEEAEARADKAEGRMDKSRNRIATMFNTNPEAFVDPVTGEPTVDAKVLGWFTTGESIPIFPQTRRIMNQRDQKWKQTQELLSDSLKSADSVESARQITGAMLNHLGWQNAPPEVVEGIVNSMGTPEFQSQLFNTFMRYGGSSGVDAAIFAGENGLPLDHPDVLRLVKFSSDSDLPPSQKLSQRFIETMERVRIWEGDPANAAQVLQIRQAALDPLEAGRTIVENALPLQADRDFYFDKANVPSGIEVRFMQQQYNDLSSKYGVVETVRGAGSIEEGLNMTDEQWQDFRAENAARGVEEFQQGIAETAGGKVAQMLNVGASRLQSEVPGLGYDQLTRVTQKLWEQSLAVSKGDFLQAQELFNAAIEATIDANTR